MTVGPELAATRGPVRVVGTGLLGASVGLGLAALGVRVQLSDPSPTALALAADLGAGTPATADDEPPRLVVVAAPPDVTATVVAAELLTHSHAVVTDVASVKAAPLRVLTECGADLARYVGGHPLAGRERGGPIAARGDLFLGRPWVLCPAEHGGAEALGAVRALVTDLGAVPIVMDAATHDDAVAGVSHLPQVAASLVAARLRALPDQAVALAGQGVRDVTRIAASDPVLWAQILAGNAGPVAAVLRGVQADLDAVVRALERLEKDPHASGARAELARVVAAGQDGQSRIPGKHGAPPTRYSTVTVVVPDTPGQLGRLLLEVGEIGVNLEDLHLEHSPGQPVGLAEISVLPAAAQRLGDELRARGWSVPGQG